MGLLSRFGFFKKQAKKDSSEKFEIRLTKKAAAHLKEMMAEHNAHEMALRLNFERLGTGWVAFDRTRKGDAVFESRGIKIVVNQKDIKNFKSIEIDWVEESGRRGLILRHACGKNHCQCGNKFQPKF